uniref:HoxA14 homolog n=1 Tax=Neoceratodus forsteri TaxID=7892 RepID=G8YY18_NEOFS|nr:HoxA14 homolog [Neoceratodus forsteri]
MIFPGNLGYASSLQQSAQASRSYPFNPDELGFTVIHPTYEMDTLEAHRYSQLQNGESQFPPRVPHPTCSRAECPGVSRVLPKSMELPRFPHLTQDQTDSVDPDFRLVFPHSAYCGQQFTAGSLNPGTNNSPHSLGLSFHSPWPAHQVMQSRQRKKRVPYTKYQITELEKAFEVNRFLTPESRQHIAVKLGLTERQVKIWFQNQRQKEKKLLLRQPAGISSSVTSPIGPPEQ